jgi:hypothetical protein
MNTKLKEVFRGSKPSGAVSWQQVFAFVVDVVALYSQLTARHMLSGLNHRMEALWRDILLNRPDIHPIFGSRISLLSLD